jgi:hypothetical protein
MPQRAGRRTPGHNAMEITDEAAVPVHAFGRIHKGTGFTIVLAGAAPVASDHTAPTPNPAQQTSLSQSRGPTRSWG